MALDDFMETEVAAAAAVTAAVFSPRVRGLLRRGLVYGVAGAMEVGAAVRTAASGVADAAQARGAQTGDGTVAQAGAEAGASPTPRRSSRRTSPTEGTPQ